MIAAFQSICYVIGAAFLLAAVLMFLTWRKIL